MASKIWYEVQDTETGDIYELWSWTSYGAIREVSKEYNIPEKRLRAVDVEERKLKEHVYPRYMLY